MEWFQAVEIIQPYIVNVLTPGSSGTGFFFRAAETSDMIAVATAAHVIPESPWYQTPQPIKLVHSASGKERILNPPRDCSVQYQTDLDTAVVFFDRNDFPLGGLDTHEWLRRASSAFFKAV